MATANSEEMAKVFLALPLSQRVMLMSSWHRSPVSKSSSEGFAMTPSSCCERMGTDKFEKRTEAQDTSARVEEVCGARTEAALPTDGLSQSALIQEATSSEKARTEVRSPQRQHAALGVHQSVPVLLRHVLQIAQSLWQQSR